MNELNLVIQRILTFVLIFIAALFFSCVALPGQNSKPSVPIVEIESMYYEDTEVVITVTSPDSDGDQVAYEFIFICDEDIYPFQWSSFYPCGEKASFIFGLYEGSWVVRIRARDEMNEESECTQAEFDIKRPICGKWIQQPSNALFHLLEVQFIDEDCGWALSQDNILRTIDSGETWETHHLPTIMMKDLHFVDKDHGWIVGQSGSILYTEDGGIDWVQQLSGTESSLYSVYFTDIDRGWTVGNYGKALRTTDGGKTWNQMNVGLSVDLRGVFFSDIFHGWIGGFLGKLSSTADGGQTWQALPSFGDIHDKIFFLNNEIGWVTQKGAYSFLTTNGGNTWELFGKGNYFYSFYDIDNAWGFQGNDVFYSWDGGNNWAYAVLPVDNCRINSIFFINYSTGWAVGNDGLIFKTTNGGLEQPGSLRKSVYLISKGLKIREYGMKNEGVFAERKSNK